VQEAKIACDMIISSTPYRISLFGGGSYYPAWFRKRGGAVLSTTIDKYCYISCRVLPPFFTIRHRIVWSHIETVSSIAEILHPAVRAALKVLGFDDSSGIELHHQGDLPARSGIGSSSSFCVGLIKALLALRGQGIGKQELATAAIKLEQETMKEVVGVQDQVAAAYGGFNRMSFSPDGSINVRPIDIPPSHLAELESRLLLFFTGASRLSTENAREFVARIDQNDSHLRAMSQLVEQATAVLELEKDLDDFGRLLHENWMLKRELGARVSNPVVDGIYATALAHGALGGKLLGSGSSGFIVFYVPHDKQPAVLQALANYIRVPFKCESEGCRLIYQDSLDMREELEAAESSTPLRESIQ
jgi:D-glycero-alpha-D-manno-heptose-7-phosphate kinase